MATKRKGTKPTADQLEEQARQEWEELLRLHVPGFAFSEYPAGFALRNSAKGLSFISIGEWWKDPGRWPEIPRKLGHGPPDRAVKVPNAWRYADIAPKTPPHPFDLTNLRKYDLHGRQVPGHYGRSYAATAMMNFRRRLLEVFLEAPLNRKHEELTAFLEHHHSNGGNPTAFRDHVEGLLSKWAEEPPTDPRKLDKVPLGIEDLHRLTKTVEAWCAKAIADGKVKLTGEVLPIERRFPSPAALGRFMAKLKEDDLISDNGTWIGGKSKAKLLGAYFGTANALDFDMGSAEEAKRTLEDAFQGWTHSNPREAVAKGADCKKYRKRYYSHFRNG